MTPRQYYQLKPKEVIQRLAERSGTSFGNFKQIAIANGSVGKDLAARLAENSDGEMTELEILYPERYETKKTA